MPEGKCFRYIVQCVYTRRNFCWLSGSLFACHLLFPLPLGNVIISFNSKLFPFGFSLFIIANLLHDPVLSIGNYCAQLEQSPFSESFHPTMYYYKNYINLGSHLWDCVVHNIPLVNYKHFKNSCMKCFIAFFLGLVTWLCPNLIWF